MKRWSRYLAGVAMVTGLLALAARAGAETCTLEMKRVSAAAGTNVSGLPSDYMFRTTRPQYFFKQLGGPEGLIVGPDGKKKPEFSTVIKKEPAKYEAESPFRGVAELGSKHYGFVLDIAPPKEEKKEGSDEKKGEAKEEEGGFFSALAKTLSAPLAKNAPKPLNFTRLYFDLNGNGDLTDDGVIEAANTTAISSASMTRSAFPVVGLKLDVDGKKVDYAFTISVYSSTSGSFSYANASLNAAAYREGQIMLDGAKRRVVLVDFNSNGRFDDVSGINEQFRPSDGTVYPEVGDMLYIDPQPVLGYRNPYDSTTGSDQYQVSRLICYHGSFFDLKIDPSGESLSLEPSPVAVGYVTNPNKGYRAIVYGDKGMLDITDDGSGKAALPEGEWKLLSYTISQTETAKPETEKKPEETSILGILSSVLPGVVPAAQLRPTIVSARATAAFKAIKVAGGQTTEFPFGPPYSPTVTAAGLRKGQTAVSLGMTLVGAASEVCNNLVVNGARPSQPEFTISTKDGKEVASGKFAYG